MIRLDWHRNRIRKAHRERATLEGMGDSAAEGFEKVPEAAETSMSSAKDIVSVYGKEIQETAGDVGLQSAQEFEAELKKTADAARTTMSNVNQTVRSAAGEARSAGYSVGAAISQGAAAGVRAYAAQVAAEAAAMVRDAIAAAKAEAQSASPSKKMIKLGRDIDEGLIIGIKDLESSVKKQIRETMGKITSIEVETPQLPDYMDSLIALMGNSEARSAGISEVVTRLDKIEKQLGVTRNVSVTQNIYAENTSYVGQQREAQRRFKELSREIGNI